MRTKERERGIYACEQTRLCVKRKSGYLLFRFAVRRAASNLSLSFRFLHIWPSLVEDTEVYFESNSTPNLTTVIGRICAVNPCFYENITK